MSGKCRISWAFFWISIFLAFIMALSSIVVIATRMPQKLGLSEYISPPSSFQNKPITIALCLAGAAATFLLGASLAESFYIVSPEYKVREILKKNPEISLQGILQKFEEKHHLLVRRLVMEYRTRRQPA